MQTLTGNQHGSHLELLQYDNNGWECELDKTNTSIVICFFKP